MTAKDIISRAVPKRLTTDPAHHLFGIDDEAIELPETQTVDWVERSETRYRSTKKRKNYESRESSRKLSSRTEGRDLIRAIRSPTPVLGTGHPLMRFAPPRSVILIRPTALTAPSMRFAIGVGVILLRYTALTASYSPNLRQAAGS